MFTPPPTHTNNNNKKRCKSVLGHKFCVLFKGSQMWTCATIYRPDLHTFLLQDIKGTLQLQGAEY